MLIYNSNFFAKRSAIMPAIVTVAALVLGTLDNAAQIRLVLSVSRHPRYPWQVQPLSLSRALRQFFARKFSKFKYCLMAKLDTVQLRPGQWPVLVSYASVWSITYSRNNL
jgi:hypothetical protein